MAHECLKNEKDISHITIRQTVKSIKFKEQVKVKKELYILVACGMMARQLRLAS